jgi:hypothetical protein
MMNEFDTRVFDQLEAFTPELSGRPDWLDVLRRARRSRARRLVVAVAAAAAVLCFAAAVTAALGGFDKWLSGEPGRPAPRQEQQRFQQANERSLAAFPKDTKLRELIRTEVGGGQYALFGFRSGGSLCLRLDAVGLGRSIGPTCAPVSAILHASAPLLVVVGNDGFQNQHGRAGSVVSFGLVADGVSRVEVRAVDGSHRAALGGNAYLWVQRQPNSGQRVLSLTPVRGNGSRITVPVTASFGLFGVDASPERRPRGPARVEARIANPTVGWFVRGERRGFSLEEVRRALPPARTSPTGDPGSRLVKPDPDSNALVGLSGRWCILFVERGGPTTSCTAGREFWARGPINEIITGGNGEFMRVSGAAADGVRRVIVFLAGGDKQPAALRDNLFTTLVAKKEFPVRVVAYDRRNRVVGVHTWRINFGTNIPAQATRNLRQVARLTGPNGVEAVARVGPEIRGYRCWRVDFSSGQSPGGCLPPFGTGPSIWVDLVQPVSRDLFVIGHVRWPVEQVRLEFANGEITRTRPRAGLFLLAIPRSQLQLKRQAAFAAGYTSEGYRIQQQGVVFRATP